MTVYDKLRLLGEAVTQEKAAEAMGVSPYYFRQVLRDKYRVGRHLSPISRPLRLRNTTPITPPRRIWPRRASTSPSSASA